MITTDAIISLSLLAFLFIWWMPNFNHRTAALTVCAVIALLSGIWGVLDYRWQNAAGAIAAIILIVALLVGQIRKRKTNGKTLRTSRTFFLGTLLSWKLLSGVAVALLVTLSIAPVLLFPVTDFPPPSGKFPVGIRSFALTDASRPGILAAKPDEPRRLLVKVWYPANGVSGLKPRPYFTDLEAQTLGTRLGRMVLGAPFLFQYIKHSMTNSYPDAPLLNGAKDLPVVIYSHGYAAHAGQNTALMEELASHGYMVYSIQHTYDSSDTVFPNGDVIPMDPELLKALTPGEELSDAERKAFVGSSFDERYAGQVQAKQESIDSKERISTQSTQIWVDDRIFLLDTLQQGAVPESVGELVAASNFSRTGEMGMSFGGSTTGVLCMLDSRCAAAVNLDGGGYQSTPLGKNIPVPFMMLYSDFKNIRLYAGGDENIPARGFNDFSYERLELAGLRKDVYRMMVRDVKHLGVTDLPLIAKTPLSGVLFGTIDGQAIIQIQNEFVRTFFDTHLLGQDIGFPQAQYKKYRQWVVPTDIRDVSEWWLATHPEDVTQRIVLETTLGDIELALYPKRAPLAVKQFLNYVSNRYYEGASFHRVTDAWEVTGNSNARFFINIEDNTGFDTGSISLIEDGQGTTVFGRVMRGIRLLEQAQSLPSDAIKGQALREPPTILRAYTL